MYTWKFIFECISVAVGGLTGLYVIVYSIARLFGKNLIDEWFARRNKKFQAQLDKELVEYKSNMDKQLEVLKISYGNVFSKRMDVFMEACVRMQKMEVYSKTLTAYNDYDCKNNVDFERPCKSNCAKDCIVNYCKVVFEMRDYALETEFWFKSNEFFFSIDQYTELIKVHTEFIDLLEKALNIIKDKSLSEKDRADKCFNTFAKFRMNKYRDARTRLIETFRYTLNVPLLSK